MLMGVLQCDWLVSCVVCGGSLSATLCCARDVHLSALLSRSVVEQFW